MPRFVINAGVSPRPIKSLADAQYIIRSALVEGIRKDVETAEKLLKSVCNRSGMTVTSSAPFVVLSKSMATVLGDGRSLCVQHRNIPDIDVRIFVNPRGKVDASISVRSKSNE